MHYYYKNGNIYSINPLKIKEVRKQLLILQKK